LAVAVVVELAVLAVLVHRLSLQLAVLEFNQALLEQQHIMLAVVVLALEQILLGLMLAVLAV
jgi:hypothetical protein